MNKKKKYIIAFIFFIVCLGIVIACLILKDNKRKKTELNSFMKQMGYKNEESMLEELPGKTIYIKGKKIWINDINTNIDSSLYIKKEEHKKIENCDTEDNQFVIKCSNGKKIGLIRITKDEKEKINSIANKKGGTTNIINNQNETSVNGGYEKGDTNTCKIVIPKKSAVKGEKIKVPVELKNNPGILGMTIMLKYDDNAIDLQEVNNGEVFDNQYNFTKPRAFQDGCKFLWDGMSVEKDNIKNGVLVTFIFQVNKEAEKNVYPICIESVGNDVINENMENIELNIENGEIKITD